jgi:hypothetical protein
MSTISAELGIQEMTTAIIEEEGLIEFGLSEEGRILYIALVGIISDEGYKEGIEKAIQSIENSSDIRGLLIDVSEWNKYILNIFTHFSLIFDEKISSNLPPNIVIGRIGSPQLIKNMANILGESLTGKKIAVAQKKAAVQELRQMIEN